MSQSPAKRRACKIQTKPSLGQEGHLALNILFLPMAPNLGLCSLSRLAFLLAGWLGPVQVLQGGSKGHPIRPAYNLDFTASNQKIMPLKIIKATLCGGEILSCLSFRLAGQQDNFCSQQPGPTCQEYRLHYDVSSRVMEVGLFFFFLELRLSRCMVEWWIGGKRYLTVEMVSQNQTHVNTTLY